MQTRVLRIKWFFLGSALSAFALTSVAGATHRGVLEIAHTIYVRGGAPPTGLDCDTPVRGCLGVTQRHPGAFANAILGSNLGGGSGVVGESESGDSAGVYGITHSNALGASGVLGWTEDPSLAAGVRGSTLSGSESATGVEGIVGKISPSIGDRIVHTAGVRGINARAGDLDVGVSGHSAAAGDGVYGSSPLGRGVYGVHSSTQGSEPGVKGLTNSGVGRAAGVLGEATHPTENNVAGVYGRANNGIGVSAYSSGGVGLSAYGGRRAAEFVGDVRASRDFDVGRDARVAGSLTVSGPLFKPGGGFRINHPLDPAKKYLQHSFVESPEMLDVYNGNARTNARGIAIVELPGYFQALNRDYRYQLTPIGQFAQAVVAKEVERNRFTIRTDKPNVKVSWQVTGVRKDAWANRHRVKVVQAKTKRSH